jgi:hypothetical protein
MILNQTDGRGLSGPNGTSNTGRIRTGLFGLSGCILLIINILVSGSAAITQYPGSGFSDPIVLGAMCFPLAVAIAVIGLGLIWKRRRNWRWVARGLFWSMLVLCAVRLPALIK